MAGEYDLLKNTIEIAMQTFLVTFMAFISMYYYFKWSIC